MWKFVLGGALAAIVFIPFRIGTQTTHALPTDTASTLPPVNLATLYQPLPSSLPFVGGTTAAVEDVVRNIQEAIPRDVGFPVRLRIPSIGLSARVLGVGTNQKGEMDVPDGASSSVGWYKYGTAPGKSGTAVLDAHVFAAFDKLRDVKVGEDIFVDTSTDTTLHFVVEDSRVYSLNEITSKVLFGADGARRLNLITCAGEFVPSWNTYDHRLVVFATLRRSA